MTLTPNVFLPTLGLSGGTGVALKRWGGIIYYGRPSLGMTFAAPRTISHNTGSALEFFLQAPANAPSTAKVTDIYIGIGTITTSRAYEIRLETVDDTTGRKSGTLVSAGANLTGITLVASSYNQVTLTTPATVTLGQRLAVVAVSNGTQSVQFLVGGGQTDDPCNCGYPYCFDTAAAAKSNSRPALFFKYDDGNYYTPLGCITHQGFEAQSITNATNPSEVGNSFTVPTLTECIGCWQHAYAGGGNYDVILYDSDGTTVLGSYSHDKDSGYNGGTHEPREFCWTQGPVKLKASTSYSLVVKPTSATTVNVATWNWDVAGNLARNDRGGNMSMVSRQTAGSGSFTATANKECRIGPILIGTGG